MSASYRSRTDSRPRWSQILLYSIRSVARTRVVSAQASPEYVVPKSTDTMMRRSILFPDVFPSRTEFENDGSILDVSSVEVEDWRTALPDALSLPSSNPGRTWAQQTGNKSKLDKSMERLVQTYDYRLGYGIICANLDQSLISILDTWEFLPWS